MRFGSLRPVGNAVDRAVRAVRREWFVPSAEQRHAGEDRPLPIGHDQTISQPSLVATMTHELNLSPEHRVLEIGTGSGYQTALLAEIAREVFTIERIMPLAETARVRLGRLGYQNIYFRVGDGAAGWPEAAPFDAIVVTAAPSAVPPALVDQLARQGRMVIPVGPTGEEQVLLLVAKDADGTITQRELCGVRFVPLVSESWPES